ncbi:hypothetical protein LEN26_013091 [Aphanomyces euteiches]|nr:hypothetical protein AeMF1_019813 [Aphanomyces euteiches]KAH9113795.1 hypothetical protein LEN26_013091 [Aphanomyces euteiches]KAH9191207.1 hypothetical protein AeNC1_006814 [Aphanomyces euteiches]
MDERSQVLEELQCIICHECLYKPMTLACGHSFCRLCLLKSCEAQGTTDQCTCAICREPLCGCVDKLNVNVKLWNVIRIMYPDGKEEAEEEAQFQAAKAIFEVQQEIRYTANASEVSIDDNHRREQPRVGLEDARDSLDMHPYQTNQRPYNDGGIDSNPWIMRLEEHVAEELRIRRSIVMDPNDENIDGRLTMRLAFGLVEFPSIFEAYVDGQTCQIAMLQMEEDEESDSGFPVFMAESGEDDALVVPNFFGSVRLTVFANDDLEQPLLRRQTSARQGMIEFPNLRLDVPQGMYLFRFEDLEHDVFIEIVTEIRDPAGSSPLPVQSERQRSGRPRPLLLDRNQASTLRRRQDEWDDSEDDLDAIMDHGRANHYDSEDSFLAHEDSDLGEHHSDEEERDEEEEEEEEEAPAVRSTFRRKRHVESGSDDEDDDDAHPRTAKHQRRLPRHQIDSDEDQSED